MKRLRRLVARSRIKRQLLIIFDFHGTLVNPQKVKRESVWTLFKKRIEEGLLRYEIATEGKLLTRGQYAKMRKRVFENKNVFLQADPYHLALEVMEYLYADGHAERIITACDPPAFKTAKAWCADQDEDRNTNLLTELVPMETVGRDGSKVEAVRRAVEESGKKISVFIGDDLPELAELKKADLVTHLFLMDRPYNQHVDESGIAERIHDFEDLYIILTALAS